jgi:hypothetical protein
MVMRAEWLPFALFQFADLKMKHPPDGKGTRTAAAASEAAAAVGGGDQCER